MVKIINTPLSQDIVRELRAGQRVLISGVVYTARDAAHKRFAEIIESGGELPVKLQGQVIYYAGPCPAKPGSVIGSCGPTTSGRMDRFTPLLIKKGLAGMIGKGSRNSEVISAMKEFGAVYFGAVGGAGALISQRIISQEVIAFPELGTEAVRRLVVKEFPAVVVIDMYGTDLYIEGREKYRKDLHNGRVMV